MQRELLGLLVLASMTVLADVKMPSIFSDNMVLQRDIPINVWGWADAGEKVRVVLEGDAAETEADAAGCWRVTLPPRAVGGPSVMEISGKNTIQLSNILFGDVWIAGGQSNMELSMDVCENAQEELARSENPKIRLFYGNTFKWNALRQADIPGRAWTFCNAGTLRKFSATGYYFAKHLVDALDVPVGIVSVNWGGTKIEPWTSVKGFATRPALKSFYDDMAVNVPGTEQYEKVGGDFITAMEKWVKEARAAKSVNRQLPPLPPHPLVLLATCRHEPGVLFNNMIAPLLNLRFKGVIWYQGCSNRMDGMLYKEKMHALAAGWRMEFNFPDMPLYFVQISPYRYGNGEVLPKLWEAQQAYADEDDKAHMAVTTDIGNYGDIHPRNKKDVGKRLALLALKYTYGQSELIADSPFFDKLDKDGASLVVTFRNAAKLQTKDGQPAQYFEIAGADGSFYPAEATLDGNKAVLTSAKVQDPYLVRFAWKECVTVNLYNENWLPAAAFRAGLPLPAK